MQRLAFPAPLAFGRSGLKKEEPKDEMEEEDLLEHLGVWRGFKLQAV